MNKSVVKIAIFGDFRSVNQPNIRFEKELLEIVNCTDINVCNFEAPILTKTANPQKKSGPALYQSVGTPSFLKENGFNVILLANNHIMDYGIDGCEATIKAFDGITTVGVGKSRDAFSAKYVEVKGRKIGFISLVQNEFGVVKYKDDDSYGAAWVNSPDVVSVVKEAKSQCDYLFVFPHAGVEHTAAPLPEWRKIYKNFIDLGTDAVVASHPHCPQGWEYYKGKPIYYSLGDFYFDELTYDDLWYKSIVVELNIGDTIEAKEHFICFDDKTGIIEIDKSNRMKDYLAFANRLLKNEKEYNEYIDEMCAKHWMGIKYGLLRGVCGVSLKMRFKYIVRLLGCMILGDKDEMYLLNALQCESHRWVMERYLRNNNIK